MLWRIGAMLMAVTLTILASIEESRYERQLCSADPLDVTVAAR